MHLLFSALVQLRSSHEIAQRRLAAATHKAELEVARAKAKEEADIARMKDEQRAAAQTLYLAEAQARRNLKAECVEASWGSGDDAAHLSHAPIAATSRERGKFHFGGGGSNSTAMSSRVTSAAVAGAYAMPAPMPAAAPVRHSFDDSDGDCIEEPDAFAGPAFVAADPSMTGPLQVAGVAVGAIS